MITTMTRVRILGPRARRDTVLEALQDVELVHLAPPKLAGPG
jgi:vacuolar-type H+-ATPase subunit I/STV1